MHCVYLGCIPQTPPYFTGVWISAPVQAAGPLNLMPTVLCPPQACRPSSVATYTHLWWTRFHCLQGFECLSTFFSSSFPRLTISLSRRSLCVCWLAIWWIAWAAGPVKQQPGVKEEPPNSLPVGCAWGTALLFWCPSSSLLLLSSLDLNRIEDGAIEPKKCASICLQFPGWETISRRPGAWEPDVVTEHSAFLLFHEQAHGQVSANS